MLSPNIHGSSPIHDLFQQDMPEQELVSSSLSRRLLKHSSRGSTVRNGEAIAYEAAAEGPRQAKRIRQNCNTKAAETVEPNLMTKRLRGRLPKISRKKL
ncbi:hypothetical protein RUND412_006434 [Rhizina undulata]